MVIVVVEKNEKHNEPPPIIQNILEEFKDIVPNKIPQKLPPIRDIQHHIDLVPDAILPNKVAYRMSLKEHKGFKGKLMNLYKRG